MYRPLGPIATLILCAGLDLLQQARVQLRFVTVSGKRSLRVHL